ncbi:hypothetical protein WA158_004064 [Blastocystis sp. Blastoise]
MESSNSNGETLPQQDPNVDIEMEELDKPIRRQRLMIEKIVLENFKSYAGIQEIGPFHKSFTSIVGPNGSGKSNVIDALLFVFGKRASKLRLKKVSELIHNSAEHPNYTYASVAVYFTDIEDQEDEDAYIRIPNTQIKISRVARRDNQSDYYIDDRKSSFREVTELLKGRGIDLDNNRFLILQGEVEQIALMKPKSTGENDEGLLEYLEEIIGSNKYIQDIEEKEKEMETINEQRQEQLNRVKLVQKERDGLEDAKVEAEKYIDLERDILVKKGYIVQKQLVMEKEGLETLETKRNGLEQSFKEKTDKYKENEAVLKEKSAQFHKVEKDYEEITVNMQKTKEQYNTFERMDIEYHEELKGYKNTIKQLTNKITSSTSTIESNTKSISDYETSLPQLQKTLQFAQEQKDIEEEKLEKLMTQLKEITKDLRQKKEAIQKKMNPLLQQKSEFENKMRLIDTEMDCITKRDHQQEQERVDLYKQKENQENSLSQYKVELEQTKQLFETKSKEMETVKNAIYMLNMDIERIMGELKNKRQQCADIRSLGTTETSRVITAIMQQTKDRALVGLGIYGRLGDLGTIDKMYDIPASTASGAWGDLVVETTDDGQRVIEWLKREHVGKIRCIILEKLKYIQSYMNNPFTAPNGSKRLFDLIKPSQIKFLPAFYYALRDTLVTNNLDTAVQLCYKEHVSGRRVVTLNGQLIDSNGTMSGGGNSQRRGQIRLSGGNSRASSMGGNTDNIEDVEKAVAQLEGDLEHKRTELTNNKMTQKTLQDSLQSLQLKISKIQADLQSVTDSLQSIDQRISLLPERGMMDTDDKLHDLQVSKKELESSFVPIRESIDRYMEEMKENEKEINARGGEGLKKQQTLTKRSTDAYEQTQKDISTTTISIKNLTKQQNKCIKEKQQMEKEKEDIEEKIKNTKEKFASIEQDAIKVMKAFEAAQKAMEGKEEELEEIRGQFEKYKKDSMTLKREVEEVKEKKEEEEKKIEDKKKKITGYETRLNVFKRDYKSLQEEIEEDSTEQNKQMEIEPEQQPEATVAPMTIETPSESNDNIINSPTDTNPSIPAGTAASSSDVFSIADEDIEGININALERDILRLEGEKDILQKQVNVGAIREYNKKNREMMEREKELDEVTNSRDQKRKEYDDLRKERLNMFMEGFNEITLKLKEMYQMITLGGDAELELVDSLDPFSEGIVFSVRPPKKSWKNISNLSGGEKTLSSLALIFALHHFKPTSLYIYILLYILDEIDAALDFRNVSIVAHYIKERTKDAQFIIISLRNNMFELADRLVGIYKTNNATKSVTLNPKLLAEKMNIQKE